MDIAKMMFLQISKFLMRHNPLNFGVVHDVSKSDQE